MVEKVIFTDSEGRGVNGLYADPSGEEGRVDVAVVMCHGFGSSKNGSSFVAWERMFNDFGLATLRFDSYGCGESTGKFEDRTTSICVDEAVSAIKFMRQKGYEKIALIGSSFGGLISNLAAGKTEVDVLALKSPVSNFKDIEDFFGGEKGLKEWREKGYKIQDPEGRKLKLKYDFYRDLDNCDGYNNARRLKMPVLIVHGSEDNVVPIEQSKKLLSLLENGKLEIIEGEGHSYKHKEGNFEKMLKIIFDFIVETI